MGGGRAGSPGPLNQLKRRSEAACTVASSQVVSYCTRLYIHNGFLKIVHHVLESGLPDMIWVNICSAAAPRGTPRHRYAGTSCPAP